MDLNAYKSYEQRCICEWLPSLWYLKQPYQILRQSQTIRSQHKGKLTNLINIVTIYACHDLLQYFIPREVYMK